MHCRSEAPSSVDAIALLHWMEFLPAICDSVDLVQLGQDVDKVN